MQGFVLITRRNKLHNHEIANFHNIIDWALKLIAAMLIKSVKFLENLLIAKSPEC